jgi:hypothetical protein
MKLAIVELFAPQDGQLVASFGSARLVRKLHGKYILHGGAPEDNTAAKEWISLFFHEAVPQYLPRTQTE